ncbi:MAG: hypothetical protein ACKVOH_01905 [Chlamydiales bacterium]
MSTVCMGCFSEVDLAPGGKMYRCSYDCSGKKGEKDVHQLGIQVLLKVDAAKRRDTYLSVDIDTGSVIFLPTMHIRTRAPDYCPEEPDYRDSAWEKDGRSGTITKAERHGAIHHGLAKVQQGELLVQVYSVERLRATHFIVRCA